MIPERIKNGLYRVFRWLGLQPENREQLGLWLQKQNEEKKYFNSREWAMMDSILKLRDWKIRDVMIPRNDVISLKISDSYEQVVVTVREWQHSRYPVFDDTEDKVLGILLAKDLLGFTDNPKSFVMAKVMRKPVFEPIYRHLDALLEDFLSEDKGKKLRIHMIIAIDEYSQPAGIVTVEDLLERIVGDIEDESDDVDDRTVTLLSEEEGYLVKGSLSIEAFNAELKATLPTGIADNIAGWLAAELGNMPKSGEVYSKHGFIFQVLKADERRVYTLVVRPDYKQEEFSGIDSKDS